MSQFLITLFASVLIGSPEMMDQYVEVNQPVQEESCVKVTAGEDQNQYVRIASDVSDDDIAFMMLLDAESGLWTPDRKSPTNDYGFCQINKKYHPEIVNDPRFFSDPRWQIEQCWKLYNEGTTFYAKADMEKSRKYFKCPTK